MRERERRAKGSTNSTSQSISLTLLLNAPAGSLNDASSATRCSNIAFESIARLAFANVQLLTPSSPFPLPYLVLAALLHYISLHHTNTEYGSGFRLPCLDLCSFRLGFSLFINASPFASHASNLRPLCRKSLLAYVQRQSLTADCTFSQLDLFESSRFEPSSHIELSPHTLLLLVLTVLSSGDLDISASLARFNKHIVATIVVGILYGGSIASASRSTSRLGLARFQSATRALTYLVRKYYQINITRAQPWATASTART